MNARQAFLAAVAAHEGVNDKAGVPYIFHPIEVAAKVKELGEDFEVIALLHDVLEDTGYTFLNAEEVGPEQGLTLAQLQSLDAITRRENEPYFDYIRRCREDFVARVVKIADLQHNLSPERSSKLPAEEAASLARRYADSLRILLRSD